MTDNVNHPRHYEKHKMVIEPIDVIEMLPFALGSCIKYVVRARDKGNELEDLQKAQWFHRRFTRLLDKGWDLTSYLDILVVFLFSDIPLLRAFASDLNSGDWSSLEAWEMFGEELDDAITRLKDEQ